MTYKIPQYPLEEILGIKKKRVDAAMRVVKEKQEALENEKQKLQNLENERDKVKSHKQDKLNQLHETLNKGTTSDEILLMKAYLEVVEGQLEEAEKKVQEQQKAVENAENELETAKEELRKKRKEVDKLEEHRREWLTKAKKGAYKQEQKDQNEMGEAIFLQRFTKNRER